MNIKGIDLTILIGKSTPMPLEPSLLQLLDYVEVINKDEGPSGFKMVFHAGRGNPPDRLGNPVSADPALKPFNRVILTLNNGASVEVIFDGMITQQDYAPATPPEPSMFTVMGEDLSVMMDLEEKTVEHPDQDDYNIATKIIADYTKYGIRGDVTRPPVIDKPLSKDRIPVQIGTDLDYLNDMADRYGYLFYIEPGPSPGGSRAYWGPPKLSGSSQPALSVDMGSATNVKTVNFIYDSLKPTTVSGWIQDGKTNKIGEIMVARPDQPTLSARPAIDANKPNNRHGLLVDYGGLTTALARARAQGRVNSSVRSVLTARGELDVLRYNNVLRARGLVDMRGVGDSFDGTYYVKQVKHQIKIQGAYNQSFTLTREGEGAKSSTVTL